MKKLRAIDAQDRTDGTDSMDRLRQIGPQTGKFLALMLSSAPDGKILEIGTSAGYSTLWLTIAARAAGRKIATCELLKSKIALARETFRVAEVEDVVEIVEGDAREYLAELNDIAFCFLDTEKDLYRDCYDLLIPRMVSGGILAADNLISHADTLESFIEFAESDPRVDALVVPVENGILYCRKQT